MKIFVTGTRGIPDIPGGVEKHCQELYPRIVSLGHEVILATRSPYVSREQASWEGVKLIHLFAPRIKSLEAIVHTFLAVVRARSYRPDILHIHAVGPGLLVPVARLLGLKVVLTHHGQDYDREKWGWIARSVLRFGEYSGARFAHEVIAISKTIAEIIRKRCSRESHLIYNGAPAPAPCGDRDYLDQAGLQPGHYILAVARFVPEKGLHDLMEAFQGLDAGAQLVIAGDADHETEYSRRLKRLAREVPRIKLTGYLTGEALRQVFSHARLFVLPSYHEGFPIALLEALGYGIPVLATDIAANLEVGLPEDCYYPCGDAAALAGKLERRLGMDASSGEETEIIRDIARKYDWDRIAEQTLSVYESVSRD